MATLLNGLEAFVSAVEAGSFSGAAERLNLSRSTVGKAIARMEDRLGTRLFHRTTRSQSLTDDGHLYYERCLRALEELRAAEQALEAGRREAKGRLRVSLPVVFGRDQVAPVLCQLTEVHPNLDLDITFSDRPIDLVEDGFDLAIRVGTLADEAGLMSRRIARIRMTVCASPAYLDRHGRPRGPDDLANHTALLYAHAGWIKPWRLPQPEGTPLDLLPRGRIRLDDLGAIADAAVAGLGLAWLPCWLIRDHGRAGRLVPLTEGFPQLVTEVHALWPQAPWMPTRVRVAIDALATALAGNEEV
ncbi:LysR substrate-binding domain-containing protein [Rhodospirillum sp. A1_3_36]|uniref:LysR substrate-binding domain-containing protein n=1 Tax=Rhodospirillum sp. A1_3_36 TaxID=3391666 RepID=UPI0039A72D00